jgi:hypothetical protein
MKVPVETVARLELDVTRTLGEKYRDFVGHAEELVRILEIGDPSSKIVEEVQQRIHDEFMDTVWPACPRHSNHPLWYEAGWWWCQQDGVQVAPLGGLQEMWVIRGPR